MPEERTPLDANTSSDLDAFYGASFDSLAESQRQLPTDTQSVINSLPRNEIADILLAARQRIGNASIVPDAQLRHQFEADYTQLAIKLARAAARQNNLEVGQETSVLTLDFSPSDLAVLELARMELQEQAERSQQKQ